MRLYLEATVTIYLVERVQPFFPMVFARVSSPGVDLVASDLTRMECLIKPLKMSDAAATALFAAYFSTIEVVALPSAVFDRAADIRARFHKLKTPDALHLAAAIEARCDALLTNDSDFLACPDIRVEVI